jgi:hypothetical protein
MAAGRWSWSWSWSSSIGSYHWLKGFVTGQKAIADGSPFSLSDKVFPDLKHPLIKAGIAMMDAFFRQAE